LVLPGRGFLDHRLQRCLILQAGQHSVANHEHGHAGDAGLLGGVTAAKQLRSSFPVPGNRTVRCRRRLSGITPSPAASTLPRPCPWAGSRRSSRPAGGYFGYAGSVLDNWHRRKREPLGASASRIDAHVSQRDRVMAAPGRSRSGTPLARLYDLAVESPGRASNRSGLRLTESSCPSTDVVFPPKKPKIPLTSGTRRSQDGVSRSAAQVVRCGVAQAGSFSSKREPGSVGPLERGHVRREMTSQR
jgi:hypothetical protein